MKNTNKLRKAMLGSSLVTRRWFHLVSMFLLVSSIGGTGAILTSLSHASATGTSTGLVDFTTNEGSLGNLISYVTISTSGHSSHPSIVCSPTSGITGAHVAGHFVMSCPGSSSGTTYVFNGATRDGYHISGNSPHQAGSTFQVYSSSTSTPRTTSFELILDRDPVASTPAPAPAPAPAPTPDGPTTGNLAIHTYLNSINPGNQIGYVNVTVRHVAGNDTSCTQDPHATDENGNLVMVCDLAHDGTARHYYLDAGAVTRTGYTYAYSSPASTPQNGFDVPSTGATLNIVVTKNPPPPPPSSTGSTGTSSGSTGSGSTGSTSGTGSSGTSGSTGGSSGGSSGGSGTTAGGGAGSTGGGTSTGGSTGGTAPAHPASQKTGSAQVTVYVEGSDGHRTRLSGARVHIQSVNHETNDSTDSCNVYDQTTDGAGTPASNTNYGQVHFSSCWTGLGGTKAYQLSFVQPPGGYYFKNFKITGGATFLSGGTLNDTGVDDKFNIYAGRETTLEILLSTTPGAATNISQVITQNGVRYVPNDNNPISIQAAALKTAAAKNGDGSGTSVLGEGLDEPGDQPEPPGDSTPPSAPANLRAEQNEAGAVSLHWDASVGDPADETITYSLYRTVKDSGDEPELLDDSITDPTALDDPEGIDPGVTYLYEVIASDDSANDSDPTIIEFTTKPVTTNVAIDEPAEPGVDPYAPVPGAEDNPSTTLASPNANILLTIPVSASEERLACDVSDSDSISQDSLGTIGTASPEFTPVCSTASGEEVSQFSEDTDFSFDYPDDENFDDASLYGYDGTDWVEMPTDDLDVPTDDTQATQSDAAVTAERTLGYTAAQKKHKGNKTTYTIKGRHLLAFTLVRKTTRHNFGTPLVGLLLITTIGVAVRTVVRQRLNRKEIYDISYGDVDLIDRQLTVAAPEGHAEHEVPVVAPKVDTAPTIYGGSSDETVEASQQMVDPSTTESYVIAPEKPKDKA